MVLVTGARIAARVKRQFGDESGVQVTDDDIINWLNDAMTEAAVQNNSINLSRVFVPAVANQSLITLPSSASVAAIHSVSYRPTPQAAHVMLNYVAQSTFETMFPEWFKNEITGAPLYYSSDVSNKLRVYPAPVATDGMGFLVLLNSFFDEYENLDLEMSISPRYFQYLLEYCLMKAYEMDENWEAADRKASFIQSTLNSLHSDDANANQSKYPVIGSNPEDM